MAQSVELILDAAAEDQLLAEWHALADAGLPSSLRAQPDEHHRPHITVYAGEAIPAEAEEALFEVMADLDLTVMIGAPMVFGPRKGRCVLVRQVVPSADCSNCRRR